MQLWVLECNGNISDSNSEPISVILESLTIPTRLFHKSDARYAEGRSRDSKYPM